MGIKQNHIIMLLSVNNILGSAIIILSYLKLIEAISVFYFIILSYTLLGVVTVYLIYKLKHKRKTLYLTQKYQPTNNRLSATLAKKDPIKAVELGRIILLTALKVAQEKKIEYIITKEEIHGFTILELVEIFENKIKKARKENNIDESLALKYVEFVYTLYELIATEINKQEKKNLKREPHTLKY